MTARSGSERRQRTVQVGVRLTSQESESLAAAASARGLSLPEYLRTTALAAQPSEGER